MRNLRSAFVLASLMLLSATGVNCLDVEGGEDSVKSWVDAVNSAPDDAMAWAALGLNLPTGRKVTLPFGEEKGMKKDFNKIEVLVHALNIDPLHTESWANLAGAMKEGGFYGPDHKVKIDDSDFTHMQVLAHTLSMDDTVVPMWVNLGVALQEMDAVKIRNTAEGQLKPPPSDMEVDGVTYTAVKCFTNALALNPKEGRAWINLAISMPDDEEGNKDKQVMNALTELHEESDTDVDLSNGADRTLLLITGLELAPEEAEGWRALGGSLNKPEFKKVTYQSKVGTKKKVQLDAVNAYEKALGVDPTNGNTWFNLAGALQGKSHKEKRVINAVVSGQGFGEKDAASKALQQPNLQFRRKAWLNLGMSLNEKDEEVVVFNHPYKKQDCYVKAVSQSSVPNGVEKEEFDKFAGEEELNNAEMSEAWTLVSTTLGLEVDTHETEGEDQELKKRKKSKYKGGDVVKVDGKKYRAKDCYAQSLSYDMDNCKAWTNLGASLKKKDPKDTNSKQKVDKISIGAAGGNRKKVYTEADAYVEAIKCSEGDDSKAWANLALGMDSMDTVGPIPGFPVPVEEGTEGKLSKTHCIVKAIEVETKDVLEAKRDLKVKPPPKAKMNKLWKPKRNIDLSNLWMTLATTIEPTTTVELFDDMTAGDGTSFDEKQLKKTNRAAYDKLLASKHEDIKNRMKAGRPAKGTKARKEMDGQEYNKIDCFAMAARYNPRYASPYLSMALMMKPEDEEGEDHESGEGGMFINGKTYNRLSMVRRALELEPQEERAWAVLYLMMDPKKVRGQVPTEVTINHKKYDLEAVRRKAGKFGEQIDSQKPAAGADGDL